MAYGEACEVLHGPDFEWDKQPIDGVAAYKAGHGKKHGRYLVGDGMINTSTVLSEVRVSSTERESMDQPQLEQRRRLYPGEAQEYEQHVRQEMERRLQQEREDMERKLLHEHEEMERKMLQKREDMERKLQQEREAWECQM